MDEQLMRVVGKTALKDAWAFIEAVVPQETQYHISPDELKLLGVLVIAHIGKPGLMNALTLALEGAYRLGEQSIAHQLEVL